MTRTAAGDRIRQWEDLSIESCGALKSLEDEIARLNRLVEVKTMAERKLLKERREAWMDASDFLLRHGESILLECGGSLVSCNHKSNIQCYAEALRREAESPTEA